LQAAFIYELLDDATRASIPPEAWVVAMASHSGEPEHLRWVEWWLSKLSVGVVPVPASHNALLCGAHPPIANPHETGYSPLHHNCSGKHAAILFLCAHQGWPMNYTHPEHPYTLALCSWLTQLAVNAGCTTPLIWETDGCHLPTVGTTFHDMHVLLDALKTRPFFRKILPSIKRFPSLIAGGSRLDTHIAQLNAHVVSKCGAAGLGIIWHLDEQKSLMVKALDGHLLSRELVMRQLLIESGWLDKGDVQRLKEAQPIDEASPYAGVQATWRVEL